MSLALDQVDAHGISTNGTHSGTHSGAHDRGVRPRIAVLAVHGVGKHDPGATGDAIATLLVGHGERARAEQNKARTHDEPRYTGFAPEAIAVTLGPLPVPLLPDDALDRPRRSGRRGIFTERRGFFRALRDDPAGAHDRAPLATLATLARARSAEGAYPRDPSRAADLAEPALATRISYEFYREQLAGYFRDVTKQQNQQPRLHRTTRWRGERTVAGPTPSTADVDVYEMYWSDLSRLQSGTLSFFRALYQLLLHLPSLGRQAVDAAVAEHPDGRWRGLQTTYTWAIRCLVIGVPVLSVALMIVGLASVVATFVPDHLGRGGSLALAIGVAVAAVLVATYRAAHTRPVPASTLGWILLPIVVALAGVALGAVLVGVPRASADALDAPVRACLVVEWWAVAGAGALGAFRVYDRVRRGALLAGATVLGFSAATFLAFAFTLRAGFQPYEHASLSTIQVVYGVYSLFWMAFYALAIAAFGFAAACWWASRDDATCDEPERAKRARARAVLRTVQLSVSLSAAGFLLAAITGIGAVYQTLVKRADLFRGMEALPAPGFGSVGLSIAPSPAEMARWLPMLTHRCPRPAGVCMSAHQYVTALFAGSTTFGLPIALGLLAGCALVLVWMALPSVVSEADAPSVCTNQDAKRGGDWLSRGMEAITGVGGTLWFAMFVVIPVCSLLGGWEILESKPAPAVLAGATLTLLDTTGALFAAGAVAVAALVARFGGTALDVVLDVDNYLRSYPEDKTPTARIAERYVSLLRHLAQPRAAERPYDALIIVAHSLGTAITADVLRTLHLQAGDTAYSDHDLAVLGFGHGGSGEARIPIHFFSMGNPVRQLMNRFFPHRFWWVRDFPDGGASRPDARFDALTEAPGSPPPLRPDPRALGVASWSNAYRTGDYVGRSLWLDRWYGRTSDPSNEGRYPAAVGTLDDVSAGVKRWEACIGLGAHTHYWDATAPDVADRLDELIVAAVRDVAVRDVAVRDVAARDVAK